MRALPPAQLDDETPNVKFGADDVQLEMETTVRSLQCPSLTHKRSLTDMPDILDPAKVLPLMDHGGWASSSTQSDADRWNGLNPSQHLYLLVFWNLGIQPHPH